MAPSIAVMLNLVTASLAQLERERAPWIGRQLQPRHCGSLPDTVAAGFRWSADNGCFSGFDVRACRSMWSRLAGWPGCLFVVVPDVVSDHARTLEMWERWAPVVCDSTGGQPLAFVAQNGAAVDSLPWEELDAVFIGGDTAWKLGPEASAISYAAKERGKWVHMGRVNSAVRITRAGATLCDSFDGTKWARWSREHRPVGDAAVNAPMQLVVPGT